MSERTVVTINITILLWAIGLGCTTIFSAGIAVNKLNTLIIELHNLRADFANYTDTQHMLVRRVDSLEQKIERLSHEND